MKYKRLSIEELQSLEKEFINYLSSAQITANDWEKLKTHEIAKAQQLIDVFSDMVYEKILGKINYLEYRDSKTLNIYFFDDEKIVMVGLRVAENSLLDFNSTDVLTQFKNNNSGSVSLVNSEKKYNKEKKLEIFEMLQNGCLITDNYLFDVLRKNL